MTIFLSIGDVDKKRSPANSSIKLYIKQFLQHFSDRNYGVILKIFDVDSCSRTGKRFTSKDAVQF